MRVGFNYPWPYNHYGATFGPNPNVTPKRWQEERSLADKGQLAKIPVPLLEQLTRNLANLQKMKIEVVRIFLLSNGFNYAGHGPFPRNTPPANPAAPYHDWEFSPPLKTDPRFPYHLGLMLKAFRDASMQVIPSLVDFGIVGNSRSRDEKGLAPGGRADIIKDVSKRSVFLGTMLNDLLNASKAYKEQIYAWEVINEPSWCYSPFGPLSSVNPQLVKPDPNSLVGFARQPEVAEDEMNAFIGQAIDLINSKGFASTVGHRSFSDLTDRKAKEWNGIKPPASFLYYAGSKPQFHYYSKPLIDPYQIKDRGMFNGSVLDVGPKPFLGEFDSALNVSGKPWPELQGKDTTLNRLKVLEGEGCDLALIWPDKDPPDSSSKPDPIKLAPETRKAIVDYTGGTLPPADE